MILQYEADQHIKEMFAQFGVAATRKAIQDVRDIEQMFGAPKPKFIPCDPTDLGPDIHKNFQQ